MKILVISSVIPSPIKENENDILLKTADMHKHYKRDVEYSFVLVIPYANYLLSKISKRWHNYYKLRKQGTYLRGGYEVKVVGIPMYGNSVFRNLFFSRIGYYLNKRFLHKIITDFRPDIIHAHNVLVDSVLAFKLSKRFSIPYIITDRSIYLYKESRLVVNRLRKASAVISVNHRYKSITKDIIGKQKSHIIPHGIDQFFFDYNVDLNGTQSIHKIVTICNLLKLKNIDKVFQALDRIGGNFIYDIYGSGPDSDRLEQILSQLSIKNKVQFKGYLNHNDVPKILSEYDLFVMPSYPENFGRVFVEAMAVGLPIIGAKGAGIDGYFENGYAGYFVNIDEENELFEKLKLILSDQNMRKKMGENAKKAAREFSWDIIIDKVDSLYNLSISQKLSI